MVVAADGGKTKKHEDQCFTAVAEHLQTVLDCGERLAGDVPFHVLLHGDPAENDSETNPLGVSTQDILKMQGCVCSVNTSSFGYEWIGYFFFFFF